MYQQRADAATDEGKEIVQRNALPEATRISLRRDAQANYLSAVIHRSRGTPALCCGDDRGFGVVAKFLAWPARSLTDSNALKRQLPRIFRASSRISRRSILNFRVLSGMPR